MKPCKKNIVETISKQYPSNALLTKEFDDLVNTIYEVDCFLYENNTKNLKQDILGYLLIILAFLSSWLDTIPIFIGITGIALLIYNSGERDQWKWEAIFKCGQARENFSKKMRKN